MMLGEESYTDPVSDMAAVVVPIGNVDYEFEGVSVDDAYLQSLQNRPDRAFELFCRTLAIEDGSCVWIDIGANIGVTSAIMTTTCPAALVYSVEAGPNLFSLLCRNIERNGFERVRPLHFALSDNNGEAEFYEASAFGHIVDRRGPGSAIGETLTVRVPMRTFDDLVSENLIDVSERQISVIKVDVEGGETAVINGMRAVIERHSPLVWVELNSWTLMSAGLNPIDAVARMIEGFVEVLRVGGDRDDPHLFQSITVDDPWATARRLVHDNVVHGRSWEDIVLVPPGRKVPEQIRDLELAAPPDELEQLRRQLDLIQRSKVWRYSMPLRRVRSMFRKH